MNSDSTSPSLRSQIQNSKPAREVKLLLSRDEAIELERQLQGTFQLDPHCVSSDLSGAVGQSIDAGYSIASVYMDTPERHVFKRQPGYNRTKYRIRMYGAADWVFLEQKNKRGTAVWKHRTKIPCSELTQIIELRSEIESDSDASFSYQSTENKLAGIDPDSPNSWFIAETQRLQLQYVCMVKYRRRAYFRDDADSPMRVTFDTGVRATKIPEDKSLAQGLIDFVRGDVSDSSGLVQQVKSDSVIVEFKFVDSLPTMMRNMIADLKLSLTGHSKYRSAMALLEPSLQQEAAPSESQATETLVVDPDTARSIASTVSQQSSMGVAR